MADYNGEGKPSAMERGNDKAISESTARDGANQPYIGAVITGVVSLVVGVLVGVLVFRLNERLPRLEYQLAAPGVFAGTNERIGVLALSVSNPAQKEVENVSCELDLRLLDLKEAKIVGLQPGAYSQIIKDGFFRLYQPP